MKVPAPPTGGFLVQNFLPWFAVIYKYLTNMGVAKITQTISATYVKAEMDIIQNKLNELIGKIDKGE